MRKLMKTCPIMIVLVLAGCASGGSIYHVETDEPFAPREYYRSKIKQSSVGYADTTKNRMNEKVVNLVNDHDLINKAAFVSNGDKQILALKPLAYHRNQGSAVIDDIEQMLTSEGITVDLILGEQSYEQTVELVKLRNQLEEAKWHQQFNQFFKENGAES